MIDAHHVGSVLTVANLENANPFALQRYRLVGDTNRRFYEVGDNCLVGRIAGEIFLIDCLCSLFAILIEFNAGRDIAVASYRCVGKRNNVTQEAVNVIRPVRSSTELHAGPRHCRANDF
jgi:hypothetical protein